MQSPVFIIVGLLNWHLLWRHFQKMNYLHRLPLLRCVSCKILIYFDRVHVILFKSMLYFIMLIDTVYKLTLGPFFCFSLYLFQTQEDAQDLDALTLAKSYFDLKEYDRAAYFLKGCCSQKSYFLYMYSRYLVGLYLLYNYTLILFQAEPAYILILRLG